MFSYAQQAWINLKANKLQSFLALLGIMVGTAAVVTLLNCAHLATEKALGELKSLGTNLVSINLYEQGVDASAAKENMTLGLWYQLPHDLPQIEEIAPYSTQFAGASYQGHALETVIVGGDEHLASVLKIQLKNGRFISSLDNYAHFCVIGNKIAKELKSFGVFQPLGQQIQVDHILYTIIGIANPWMDNPFFNEDINRALIIPLKGMQAVSPKIKINYAIARLASPSSLKQTLEEIKSWFNKTLPGMTVFNRSSQQMINTIENQTRIFNLLLFIIGGISLLVGGIGIMNIMLVAISERKKEIGIRKAVGAKNKDIRSLFLLEAILLSFCGGCVGILTGLILTLILAYSNTWTP